ncbi:MAG: GntR family transcriptional regulator [Hyphomicrobiales bacterium]|nr:GntR family transcriptional regulator [Hyphomicrobiales bacterium]
MRHFDLGGNKTDLAYEKIKELVVNLQVKPGEQLQITELSEHLAVSVTPVREALTRLHAEGLIMMISKRGFFSRNIDVRDLHDLYELAFVILKHSIKRGIQSSECNGIFEEFDFDSGGWPPDALNPKSRVQRYAKQLETFYESIVQLSGNAAMIAAVKSFNDRSHFIRLADLSIEENFQLILADMAELVTLLAARDANEAVANLRRQTKAKLIRLPALARDCLASAYLSQVSDDPAADLPARPVNVS